MQEKAGNCFNVSVYIPHRKNKNITDYNLIRADKAVTSPQPEFIASQSSLCV